MFLVGWIPPPHPTRIINSPNIPHLLGLSCLYTLIYFGWKGAKKDMGEIDIKFTRFWVISTIQDHPGSGKLKKGRKIFEGHNKGQTTKFLNFYNFLAFLGSLWGKNSGALIFLVSEAIKAKKAMQRPNHRKLQWGKSNEPKIGSHDIKSYL